MNNYDQRLVEINATKTPLFKISYSGKLSREKTFTNFTVSEPPTKVSSTKFGCAIPTYVRFWYSAKVFSAKWSLLPICESLLPQKFPAIRYIHYVYIIIIL